MAEQPLSAERERVRTLGNRAPEQDLPRVRVPIRLKITIPYLILAILLAAGAAYVITQIVFDTIEERFTNQLIEAGKLASEWMVREEQSRLETLRELKNADGVAEAIQAGDAEALRELAFGITVNRQEEAVEFLDLEGRHVLAMRHKPGGKLEEYSFLRGGDPVLLQWDFVRKAYQGQADQRGDKYAGLVRADWGDYFYVSGPVYDQNGEFAGVILVGKTLTSLLEEMRRKTLAQITVYDTEGKVIATTFIDEPTLLPSQANTVIARQDDGALKRELKDLRDINVANLDYAEILGPWEVRYDTDLGILGAALVKNFYVSPSLPTRVQIFLLVALALLLVILMGVNLARFITRPLLGLVQASTEVAQGNLAIQVDADSNDEVAVLTESFNHMVKNLKKSKMDLIEAYDTTLEGWARAVELRERKTGEHTRRVAEMTVRLAEKIGFDEEQMPHVRRGALLHDIGKIGIPDAILLKPGKLTDEEWKTMRKHPQYAYEMLWQIEFLRPAIEIPYCHHEKWNGTGYPRGLQGEAIPLEARIFAIVDVWDALTSDRPYRKAMQREQVIEIIQSESGRHFDPQVVETFIDLVNGSG
jgi:putative nucleotidyltransferase with HDIG domain